MSLLEYKCRVTVTICDDEDNVIEHFHVVVDQDLDNTSMELAHDVGTAISGLFEVEPCAT